jgi:hypothetical protein
MFARLPTVLVLVVATSALLPAAPPPPPPIPYHKDLPTALKESKTLRVPTFVTLTKTKTNPPILDARVARMAKAFACAYTAVTPELAKQYELGDDSLILVLSSDGTVADKFAEALAPEKMVTGLKKHVEAARTELLKDLKPESNATAKKAALAGLAHLGHRAEDLIPLLTDPNASIKETAKKALDALPADATRMPLLDALKSEDVAVRTAVHPLAVQATGYKAAPLKVWQSGTAEDRAAAWDKWNETVQTQFPPLNRAIIAYAEFSLGAQVTNGECSSLAVEALKECKGKPMVRSGATYVWGRELKPNEPVLPGDIVQYENVKFPNGAAPHHTSVIRKVLAPGKYDILEQNVNGVKKVQPGKLDMATVKEGTIVIYRPQPK